LGFHFVTTHLKKTTAGNQEYNSILISLLVS